VKPTDDALPAKTSDGVDGQIMEKERIEAQHMLSHGARGAVLVGGVAVTLLFLGWLLFYFVLFLRRGYVG
jgi:hypothetical protein